MNSATALLPAGRGPRARLRCPDCGATVVAAIREGRVGRASLAHEENCTWLTASERGLPVAPVHVEVIDEERS